MTKQRFHAAYTPPAARRDDINYPGAGVFSGEDGDMTEGAYKPFSRPAQWIEEAAALQARIAELETENLALISRIVETDCRDYGRDEYQTQSLADQVLIDRLVAAGRMRHKRNDHKGRPIYEFVHASSEGGP